MVRHDYNNDDILSMWSKCLHATQTLTEVYGIESEYNTNSHLSFKISTTFDLYYREKKIKNCQIFEDERYKIKVSERYHD